MRPEVNIGAVVVRRMLKSLPVSLRNELISNPDFRQEFSITTDAVLSFQKGGLSFKRSSLLSAVRNVLNAPKKRSAVKDTSGKQWVIETRKDKSQTLVQLSHDSTEITVEHFTLLSPNKSLRLKIFRQEAERVGLPKQDQKRWTKFLAERAPDDEELNDIQHDLSETPIAFEDKVYKSIASGFSSINDLIPNSLTYYVRLIGECKDGQSFDSYLNDGLRKKIEELAAWCPRRGYRQALLLAAHKAIGAEAAKFAPPHDQRAQVWEGLARLGDPLTLTAAIEAGFEQAKEAATLRDALGRMITSAVSAAPVANVDPHKLLSSLIILCYGEIANSRQLASKPPYWRRLAAIAHAAIIFRRVAEMGGDATQFVEWASAARAQGFLIQCFVDLREEPRWLAEFVLADQLKNELGGRILAAALALPEFVEASGWKNVLLDSGPGSLRSQINLAHGFLPGPLEGAFAPAIELPAQDLARIREDLSLLKPAMTAYQALANAAFIFRIPDDVVDLAADALVRANYRIEPDSEAAFAPCLLGLATLAAATRNHNLGDVLVIFLRIHRSAYPLEFDIDSTLRVALLACASRANLAEWCVCVGMFLTDLAFQPLKSDDARRLHSHVLLLCHLVPELWAACGQAEAALLAATSP